MMMMMMLCIYIYIYIYNLPKALYMGLDMTQKHFLGKMYRFEFCFPSPKLVTLPRLQNPVCPNIYP